MAERIGQWQEALAAPNVGAPVERHRPEGRVVDPAASRGVGIEQDLEAAVENEPFGVEVAPDPAADPVRGFEHDHPPAGLMQRHGADEAGEAGSDDDDRSIAPGVGSDLRCRWIRRSHVRSARALGDHDAEPSQAILVELDVPLDFFREGDLPIHVVGRGPLPILQRQVHQE